ncbi:MAG: AI-2E family transporter [Planctomycetota bacterium]|jgi:predicted PurR-regulated permease PerM
MSGDQARSRSTALLLLAIAISILFFAVIRDFVLALVMAAVLTGLVRPVHGRLTKMLNGRQGLSAALAVLISLVVIVVPMVILLAVLLQQATQVADQSGTWFAENIEEEKLRESIEESPTLRKLLPYQDQIVEKAGQLAAAASSFVASAVVGGATGAVNFLLMLFVALYATYFFLIAGGTIVDQSFRHTPLADDDKHRLVTTFTSVARATLRGTLVIGLLQGALCGAAFAVVGIDGAVFWGAVMAVLSALPVVGASLVWIPVVVYLAMVDRVGAAVGLGVWCGLVVGSLDNVLRPILVGKDTEMPDLLVLLTTLGGISLFGAAGAIVGPIIGALFVTVWSLWGTSREPEPTASHGDP